MSSPSSRLRKVKRSPLPAAAGRVPFRQQQSSPIAPAGPPDSDLLGSMAARLARAEGQLEAAREEVREKEGRIRELEARLAPLSPSLSSDQLQRRCEALQRQVNEMEEFLSDYGMMWVGSEGDRGRNEEAWLPESSLSPTVDFDLIVRNVKSLNVLAGEGSATVSKTPQGATLKAVECVPLILYANGILMFQGPFRPYSDPHTQQYVQDLMDGYFPTELQPQYPNGVPLSLSDKRDVTFVPRGLGEEFPGSGRQLGGHTGPSRVSSRITTSDLPGPRLSAEQFLARLPPSVVRGGRVIDIRSDISATLGGSTHKPRPLAPMATTTVDNITSSEGGPSLTTLKVRAESGDHTHILKMKAEDTIADVWSHLPQAPPTSSSTYQLVGGVTQQVYSDPSASLQECGLVPSATLYITKTALKPP